MQRRALCLGMFLATIAVLAAGLPDSDVRVEAAGTSAPAAQGADAPDSVHVRGDRTLAEEYSSQLSPTGTLEFWFSPDGYRQDWYDKNGVLLRSLGGTVADGKAWQYLPVPAIDDGQLYTYAARPEELAAYIRVQRERFTNGDVRIAEIKERGHDWIMSPDEWRGQTVIALVEKLPPALVNGRPRGTMECYLDPGTRRLVGMAQRGPAPEGGRVESSVDVIEYGSAIPLDVFEAHWRGEAKISEGTYQVRPSGDIAFRPGESAAMHSRLGGAAERLHNAHVGAVPWDEVEQNYLRVHQEDPDNYEARMYLGRMYTRWGRFEEALALLPSDDGYWGDLNRAFCLDALGRRQEAVAIYDRLIKGELGPDNSVGAWALRGLERPTWPQDLDVSPEPGEARLKPGAKWTASSSSATAETKAAAAIDGNPVTSWSSGASQRVGQWLQIDFGSPVAVSRVLMDSWGPKTFVNNWPRGLRTSYSVDGRTWVSIAVAQAGPATGATLRLDPSVPVQAIRFEITKPVSPEWWGINELCVFGPAR